jgi:integral membrane protein (TIGR01906 family)
MTPNWLAYQYSQPDFPPSVRFTPQDRYRLASESIEYIRGNRTLEQFKALDVYDEREIKHMVDVRDLVDKVKVGLPMVAILIIVSLAALARQKENRALAARGLLNGAILTIGLFVAIGLFAAIGFQTFFTLFHKVFFVGDTWLFNYTDSLIQFYPLPFWFVTSLALVATTIVEAIIIGLIGWRWGKNAIR